MPAAAHAAAALTLFAALISRWRSSGPYGNRQRQSGKNWNTPDEMTQGMGGAMDCVATESPLVDPDDLRGTSRGALTS